MTTSLFLIEDNGVGRIGFQAKEKATGRGVAIVREMLDWFNKNYQYQSELRISDLFDEDQMPKGTKVELRVYALYNND